MLLQNDLIRLRAMEPADAEAMYRWENDTALWSLGETTRPFSRAAVKEFIAQASLDIYQARQLRLMIEPQAPASSVSATSAERAGNAGGAVGCIDLFCFDPLHRRAGVGILVYEPACRRKGYGLAALQLTTEYAFLHLEMRQLWADIPLSNTASLRLFDKAGFTGEAIRRAWVRTPTGAYEDARFVQCLNTQIG